MFLLHHAPSRLNRLFVEWLPAIMSAKRLSLWASITSSIKGLQRDEVMTRCACETEMERGQKKKHPREKHMNNNKMEM